MMAAGAAAAAAAIANAIKASGVLIRVEPEEFEKILRQVQKPLIIHSQGGVFTTKYEYLANYKGFTFYTKSRLALQLPIETELIVAKRIWIPS
jgi:hypothetical protein